jgi:hypothetical protein
VPAPPGESPFTDEPEALLSFDIAWAACQARQDHRPQSLRPYRPVATVGIRAIRPLPRPFG